ncbi:MAG: hypothetical protein QT11_C0001G0813 [archaeon GW2011_AR20]|nr:MAG: hypothetical protein QT11_C0001G0813 [archaeon GW2011_AR20]MBS3160776.1 hypothetical protein [Candidatus Woesearchaeota archaeon]
MQDVTTTLNRANQLFKTADHLAYVTYPLLKDNKLIITILENLSEASIKAMEAMLYYEKNYKRIQHFPSDFRSKIEIFRLTCSHYNIPRNYVVLIQDVHDIVEKRKLSKMEFIKNDKYVIWSNGALVSLNYEKIKEYLYNLKPFFNKVNFILKNVNPK